MNQWTSKFRFQKTKAKLRQFEKETMEAGGQTAGSPLLMLLFSFVAVCSAEVLLSPASSLEHLFDAGMIGDILLLIVGVLICGAYTQVISPGLVQRKQSKAVLLLLLLSLCSLIPARMALYVGESQDPAIPRALIECLFPVAIGPLLAAILINRSAGLLLGIWVSFVAAVFADRSFSVLASGMIATGISVFMARDVRRRSRLFKIGFIIGLSQVYASIAFSTLQPDGSDQILWQAGACVANGMLSALVVLLLLPVFEAVFGITTDISLLELSDLGHPLLQRMAIEAPGTYHHSLMVANLAQAAAREIGANELLVRVGAYFHDIGKLTKPELFAENIQMRDNPHDNLSPNMSALLIVAHVKEGVSLAVISKLPRIIIDFIQQHHGDGLISYFHHKAIDQMDQEEGKTNLRPFINEGDFRYPGPKPQVRETAIVMLADSVEAASRSLAKPTPSHIQHLVDHIVDEKIRDGQLDHCELTLSAIGKMKTVFAFSLTNILHSRISYPSNDHFDKQRTESGAL